MKGTNVSQLSSPENNPNHSEVSSGMKNDSKSSDAKKPKKTNLLDHASIKRLLDESVTEIVKSRGYAEDVRLSNIKLILGTIISIIALVAQFYPKKYPANRELLLACIGLYIIFSALLQLIIYTKEKNAFLFTRPPLGSSGTTGLVVSSTLPRNSDKYTLTIASADPKSVAANKPVELTKSVTEWFTKDGVLVEGLLWKDVDKLTDVYAAKLKKAK